MFISKLLSNILFKNTSNTEEKIKLHYIIVKLLKIAHICCICFFSSYRIFPIWFLPSLSCQKQALQCCHVQWTFFSSCFQNFLSFFHSLIFLNPSQLSLVSSYLCLFFLIFFCRVCSLTSGRCHA